MTNGDASSATERVMVSFYPVDTDNSFSSSGKTLAIHKEKSYVPLCGNKEKDLFNSVKHLKTIIALAEIAKSINGSEKTPRS